MRRLVVLAALGAVAAALGWRRGAPARLRRVLAPRPGERILAVGEGTAVHAPALAAALAPGGTLEILAAQRAPLDRALSRAVHRGVDGIAATQGDPRALPFADASFDGACLLGGRGDDGTLRELRRVVRPGGRVVVARPLARFARVAQG